MSDRKYGWKRQLPDQRDKMWFQLSGIEPAKVLPPMVDLRPTCPAVYDQGALGSCTANAIAGQCHFDMIRQKKKNNWIPSRLFIYYNERMMEDSIPYDAGANLRDGIKSLNTWGFAPEHMWAYDISKFAEQPPVNVYTQALRERVKLKDYGAVSQDLVSMKTAIASSYPIVIGFTVYESFESQEVAQTGIVPMPGAGEQILGGHAVLIVGYDDSKSMFIVRNSWGSSWGQQGYFMMPYAYFTNPNLAGDLWCVRLVP